MSDFYENIIKELASIEKIDGDTTLRLYKAVKKNVEKLSNQDAKDTLLVLIVDKLLRDYVLPLQKLEETLNKLDKI